MQPTRAAWHCDPVTLRLALVVLLAAACRKDAPTTLPDPFPTDSAGRETTPPPPPDRGPELVPNTDPLDCSGSGCLAFDAELTRQCTYGGTTVQRSTIGPYTVLHAQTDPKSVVYTSSEFFFDRTGKLVGRKLFVNEWGRHMQQGVIPIGPRARETDACPKAP